MTIYIFDATDPIQLALRLNELLFDSIFYVCYEDIMYSNDYLNWEALVQNKSKFIMSKDSFASALYRGLLKVSKLSLLLVENIDDFSVVEKAFMALKPAAECLPDIFGVNLDASIWVYSEVRPSFHYYSYSYYGVLKAELKELLPAHKFETVLHMLMSSTTSWPASNTLYSLSKLKEGIFLDRFILGETKYCELNRSVDALSEMFRNHGTISYLPDLDLTLSPVSLLWTNVLECIDLSSNSSHIILAFSKDRALFLEEVLSSLASFIPSDIIQISNSSQGSWQPSGHHIMVCTLDELVTIDSTVPSVHVFGSFPSLACYLRLRLQLCQSKCKVFIPFSSCDPLLPVLQGFTRQESVNCLALYNQLLPTSHPSDRRFVTDSGATLSYSCAKRFLTDYSSYHLSSDKANLHFVYKLKRHDNSYICTLTFPSKLNLASLDGPPQPSKMLAEQAAAWEACISLYKAGVLDSRFLPIDQQKCTLIPINLEAAQIKYCVSTLYTKDADFWNTSPGAKDVYLTSIQLNKPGYHAFAIGTNTPLPKDLLPISLRLGSSYMDATFCPDPLRVSLSRTEQLALAEFTIFMLSLATKTRLDMDAIPYFFVPLNGTAIDWSCIHQAINQTLSHLVTFQDQEIVFDADLQLYYKTQLKSPAASVKVKKLNLQMSYINTSHDLFSSTGLTQGIGQPFKYTVLYMAEAAIQSACLFPSILKTLERNLLALEVRSLLGIHKLQPTLIMEALTLKCARLPKNLHWLEFLGDSFLNMMVSFVAILNKEITVTRNFHLSNQCLYDLARPLGIDLRLDGISLTNGWRPPTYPQKPQFKCTSKNVADAMEALLGAALLSGGESTGTQCLMSFGLWPKRVDSWPILLAQLKKYPIAALPEKCQKADLQSIEKLIGYAFVDEVAALHMILNSSSTAVCPQLGKLLFRYAGTHYLQTRFPALPTVNISKILARISKLQASSNLPQIAHIKHSIEHALKVNKGPLNFGSILSVILRVVFIDSGLSFLCLHQVFSSLYSTTLNEMLSKDGYMITHVGPASKGLF
ncbi:Dicer-like protein 1, variant 2 [Entomophthora muscae]|nr:Dicer-like protein 1, variant 2 [Entomophthora muscae]